VSSIERRRTTSFDDVADLYDEVRPSYPASVIDHIIQFAGVQDDSEILEIGCGTGQMTVPFAEKGCRILALEPAPALAAIAARKCQAYPGIRILTERFEDWSPAGQTFDLGLSAQAFHWIAPEVGSQKLASVIRPNGAVALVWNRDMSRGTAFWEATQPIYRSYFKESYTDRSDEVCYAEFLLGTGVFANVQEHSEEWRRTYTAPEYLKLLETHSDHRMLDAAHRRDFMTAIQRVIAELGGSVTGRYRTLAILANRI
jgi:SAM-dependent methyltransferase